MITNFDIYVITRLDSILGTLWGATVISIIALLVFVVLLCPAFIEEMDELKKVCKKGIITSSVCLITFGILMALVPTTKEAVAIWAIPKIANDETVQHIPKDFAKLIDTKLQEWINDTGLIDSETDSKKE